MNARSRFQRDECGRLRAEGVLLEDIAAQFGTPCYVYSQNAIIGNYARIVNAFPKSKPSFRFAVKANGNLAILKLLSEQGAGFDIVSGGELARVLAVGADAKKVVFSGVGKSDEEIRQALDAGIGSFNVESEGELLRVEKIAAERGKRAPVSLRCNPRIVATEDNLATGDPESKFGINEDEAIPLAKRATSSDSLSFVGLSCHIGSQIDDERAYEFATDSMEFLCDDLRNAGIHPPAINMGGGFFVDYEGTGKEIDYTEYDYGLASLSRKTKSIILEPGRSVCATAGVLLSRIEYEKKCEDKLYWIADAGMNDFLRPALYSAKHRVVAVANSADIKERIGDVAGPVCENTDTLAHDCRLRATRGDLIAILDAGAYGMTMASNYNARPRPCEVMVDGDAAFLIRRRESVEDLFAAEFGLL